MKVWSKLIPALAAIAVLVWLLVKMSGFTLEVLNEYMGNDAPVHDPMFAEELQPTPAASSAEEDAPVVYEDNSAGWEIPARTPVDSTADELIGQEG